MRDSWKSRSLSAGALWRELGMRDNSPRFFGSIDLRYDNPTVFTLSTYTA
jgi:hypothetical protein